MSITKQRQTFFIPPQDPEGFVKRRPASSRYEQAGIERRQFPNVGIELSAEAEELGHAIDLFKFTNEKKRVNAEELLTIIRSLGYVRKERYDS